MLPVLPFRSPRARCNALWSGKLHGICRLIVFQLMCLWVQSDRMQLGRSVLLFLLVEYLLVPLKQVAPPS